MHFCNKYRRFNEHKEFSEAEVYSKCNAYKKQVLSYQICIPLKTFKYIKKLCSLLY